MDWNCTFTEERLSDYLEGKLSPVDAAAFSTHTASCANCAEAVAQVSGLLNRMHTLQMVEEPPQLAARILDATIGPRTEQKSWLRWFGWVSAVWQPRFVMGLAAAVASVVIVSYAAGLTPAKLKKADLSPGNILRSANRQMHLTYARGAKFVNDLRVVYEIQSKLQPEPEPEAMPVSSPAPAPQPEHDSVPPNATPQQKSQAAPPAGRTQTTSSPTFAFFSIKSLAESVVANSTGGSIRSAR